MAMAGSTRPELRLAYRIFVTVNILLAVYNMICFQMPRTDVKPCVLVVANHSLQEAADFGAKVSPLPMPPPQSQAVKSAPAKVVDKPQFQNRQPLQSKAATTRAPDAARLGRIGNSGAFGNGINSTPKKESAVSSKYVVQEDFILSDISVPFNDSVTLTTQATHEFLQHVPVLCSRWQGPVSVAVFAPGTDYAIALDKIAFLRHCHDPCVSANVTWHMVYDRDHAPPAAVVVDSSSTVDFLQSWNGSCASDVMEREYAQFRKAHKMTYPINVLRNVARRRARTRYILASDIELYPSANVIPRFMNLVAERWRRNATEASAPQVFVLPIFEVQAKQRPPLTKRVLVDMLRNKTAIFFHKWVCDQCQKFPKREEWVEYVPAEDDVLGILTTTKRDRTKRSWEPIYIGTNDDPFYAEELTWEGKRDKMSQSYELCLRGYDFHILDNAFLVHAPGIKTIIASEERRRVPFVKVNNAHHARIMNSLKSRYPALAKDC
uniref:Putative glycosyltransferase n=1 Tax=Rhipicephalus pulchellus TaxID=72859 RepID=L7MAL0_RHIPC